MCAFKEIDRRTGTICIIEGVNDDELYLHAVGKNAFNIYACLLARQYVFLCLRKSRQIWRQLNENPIGLYTADNSRNGFPSMKA